MTFIMADTGVQTQQPEQKQETKRKVKRVEWHVLPKSMSGGPHGIGKSAVYNVRLNYKTQTHYIKGNHSKKVGGVHVCQT